MTTTKRIVAAAIALLTLLPLAATAQAASPPPPQLPKPIEVKWILAPGQASDPFAEAAGYETVAHDDLTYPGSRLP
jgi:hypothetical protein